MSLAIINPFVFAAGGGSAGAWYSMSPGGATTIVGGRAAYIRIPDGGGKALSGIRIIGGSDFGTLGAFVWEEGVTGTPVVDAGSQAYSSGYAWEFTPVTLAGGTAYRIGVDYLANDTNKNWVVLTAAQSVGGLTVSQGFYYRTTALGAGAYPSSGPFTTNALQLELKLA